MAEATHLLGLPLKHKPTDVTPQGAGSGLDADKVDGLHASEISGGGVPSNTVVTEKTFGQSENAGASTQYSRGDHTHGTPSLPSGALIGISEDETDYSVTLLAAEQDMKSYSLGANSYSKIKVESEWKVLPSSTNRTLTIRLYYGAVLKKTWSFTSGAAVIHVKMCSCNYSEAQTSAVTIKFTLQGSADDASVTVTQHSLRVVGKV